MANPRTKKNPLLSIFLSGANAWVGAARGIVSARAKRQQRIAVRRGTKRAIALWASALTDTSPKRRKTRRT